MKDILMISNYWHFECEKSSSRYHTLAKMIVEAGMELEVVTSTFYHPTKSQREYNNEFYNSLPYKASLIYESGYDKNISIKRLISHRQLAKNTKKYLQFRNVPDVIYCFVPSLDLAEVITEYVKEKNVKLIIDILDLWPEAFKMALNLPVISNILLSPMKRKANKIYSAADEIVGVSQTYVNRALEVNKKCNEGYSVYIGAELSEFDKIVAENNLVSKPNNEIWISYIGTLGHSYDIPSVIDAISILKNRGLNNIKLMVIGDGPLRGRFEEHALNKGINYTFTGRLTYSEMIKILKACDIAVNPIVGSSAASIINKVSDYAAAGLPVINTQKSDEYRNLLTNYNAGVNCKNGDSIDLANKIQILYTSLESRKMMGSNNRKMAEKRFNREESYKILIELLKKG
jgi:glycosyltransferase involved in cell wall biosynthesis